MLSNGQGNIRHAWVVDRFDIGLCLDPVWKRQPSEASDVMVQAHYKAMGSTGLSIMVCWTIFRTCILTRQTMRTEAMRDHRH